MFWIIVEVVLGIYFITTFYRTRNPWFLAGIVLVGIPLVFGDLPPILGLTRADVDQKLGWFRFVLYTLVCFSLLLLVGKTRKEDY
jgi:uncharacterized membrane protein